MPSPKRPTKPLTRSKPASGKSGAKVAQVAARAIRQPDKATDDEVQSLAASVLTQSEGEIDVLEQEVVVVEAPSEEAPEPEGAPSGSPVRPDPEVPETASSGSSVTLIEEPEPEVPAPVAIDPAVAAKFIDEVRIQVRVPVTYHFVTPALAEAHAELVRSILSPANRPYKVSVSGPHLRVSL